MIPRQLVIAVSVMLAVVLVMSFYLRNMRRRATEIQLSAADARPIAPPAAGPTESVTLYVADDASGLVRAQAAKIPLPSGRQQRAEELLRALLRIYQQPDSPHPLPAAADVRSIYLIPSGAAVIDLNAPFADQHRSGILDEQLTVNSLVETLAKNIPEIYRVRILVEGKTRETLAGHVDLTEFFDVSTVSQAQ
jgi:hypothetical protein